MADGKVFTGFVVSERARSVLIREASGLQRELKLAQIESRTIQKQSMMPDGMVNNLTPEELADLVAYLQSLTGGDPSNQPAPARGLLPATQFPHPNRPGPPDRRPPIRRPLRSAPIQTPGPPITSFSRRPKRDGLTSTSLGTPSRAAGAPPTTPISWPTGS